MKSTTWTAAAALLAIAGAAHAADLPSRLPAAPYVAPSAPLPAFTWTGAYFGVNAGASYDDSTRFSTTGVTSRDDGVGNSRPAHIGNSDDGFTAGAQVGYNYQFGSMGAFGGSGLVVGMEADAAYLDAARSTTYVGTSTLGNPAQSTFRSGIDFLGTVRGRAGVAVNQFMVYGTGGFAYGDTFEKAAFQTAGDASQLRYYGSRSDLRTGYAYGGGVEYLLPAGSFLSFMRSSAVTVKLEYLRYDLGDATFLATNRVTTNPGSAYALRTQTDGNLARLGVNYKF